VEEVQIFLEDIGIVGSTQVSQISPELTSLGSQTELLVQDSSSKTPLVGIREFSRYLSKSIGLRYVSSSSNRGDRIKRFPCISSANLMLDNILQRIVIDMPENKFLS
jgi:hypothetical protein